MMKPRMHRPFTALPQRQRGAVIVLIAIALAAMLLMAALALDGGHMLVNKTRLQNAVDAAALSGAKTLQQVMGSGNASSLARDAALNTLRLNADSDGNGELAQAIGSGGVGGFARVELANSVYGPFSFPGPVDASYVRVWVPNYGLTGFFWNFAQSFGNGGLGAKAVAAIATAGPSPTSSPCDLVPLMLCGETVPGSNPPQSPPGTFWGYQLGQLEVLKTAASNSPTIGPGNFQLLDFGSGGKDVGELLAGGAPVCPDGTVKTKPGNTVGPSVTGVNTRFGQYQGSFKQDSYPPDLVTKYDDMSYNSSTGNLEYDGAAVTADSEGNLSAGSTPLYDYKDWVKDVGQCPNGCEGNGVFERRMLKTVIGNCSGKSGGASSVDVLGFSCFFMVRPADHSGQEAQIFGQFVKECEGDGYAGPKPVQDVGPNIIQLYKTYFNGVATPSPDS